MRRMKIILSSVECEPCERFMRLALLDRYSRLFASTSASEPAQTRTLSQPTVRHRLLQCHSIYFIHGITLLRLANLFFNVVDPKYSEAKPKNSKLFNEALVTTVPERLSVQAKSHTPYSHAMRREVAKLSWQPFSACFWCGAVGTVIHLRLQLDLVG